MSVVLVGEEVLKLDRGTETGTDPITRDEFLINFDRDGQVVDDLSMEIELAAEMFMHPGLAFFEIAA